MNITVVGAGAVGCYYGGMLARAGHNVTLVARPNHVEAIRRHGLHLETTSFDEHIRLNATTEMAAVGEAQVVLFCVKSTDTEHTGMEMKPFLSPNASVLSLQNGVDNADRLQAVLGQPVLAAVVYVATEMAGPGHVKHNGRGELVISPSATSADIANMLIAAGVPTEISDNVRGALWAKLILNCAYNAMSAIVQMPYGPLVRGEGVSAVMHDVVSECMAVAKADGVRVPGNVPEAVERIAQSMPAQYSSTAQDLARGKLSEIDHLNGFVLHRGLVLGVPTPANRVLHTLVKLMEGRPAR